MYVFLSEVMYSKGTAKIWNIIITYMPKKMGKLKRKALLKLADFQSDFSHTRSVTILSGGLAAIWEIRNPVNGPPHMRKSDIRQ